jgi:hypothetical protein
MKPGIVYRDVAQTRFDQGNSKAHGKAGLKWLADEMVGGRRCG